MLRRLRVTAMLAVGVSILLLFPSASLAYANSTSSTQITKITLGNSIPVYANRVIGIIFDSGTNWACIASWIAYFAAYATGFACATIIGCIIATLTVIAAWANIQASCR